VLVGQNGSGKSNFLDALAFVSDILKSSLSNAIKLHGGRKSILFLDQFGNVSDFIGFYFEFEETNNITTTYEFAVRFEADGTAFIKEEMLFVGDEHIFNWTHDVFGVHPDLAFGDLIDTLYLGLSKEFSNKTDILHFFENFQIIHPKPDAVKSFSLLEPEVLFTPTGENSGAKFHEIATNSPLAKNAIEKYLNTINPNFDSIFTELSKGGRVSLFFGKADQPNYFFEAPSVSDGTLRAFAILTSAFYQYPIINAEKPKSKDRFLAYEEPESGLHSSGSETIFDALRYISDKTQILLSTHSTHIADYVDLGSGREKVLIVESKNGETIIDDIDNTSLEVAQEKLFGLGELLHMRQLEPKSLVGKS
ncbi:MAG: hypothetical protein RLZZ156_1786, partial [Deinococcota bacterium]